ncbi:autotransporter family protein [Entomomonas moraniae]|nr:autotransporter outer membrane beta-barrel domain-containing protein [Entomomonas moraniae]
MYKPSLKKMSLLAITIATSSSVYALDCSLDTIIGTKTCTTHGAEENSVIRETSPNYSNLVIDNVNLNGTGQMIGFGPGPERPELANNPDLFLQISNSNIKSSSSNSWIYGGFAAIPAEQKPSQKVSMNASDSTITMTNGAGRTNGLLIESGWAGSGTGYMNIANTQVKVNTTNTSDVGSSGIGVTANYIAEITIDKNSSVTTSGDYTSAVAITGNNDKINSLDSTLTNGHQLIDNQGNISASGTGSNGIHVVSRGNGDTVVNNSGSVKHIGSGKANAINILAAQGGTTNINNTGSVSNESGSGIYYGSYNNTSNSGNVTINNTGGNITVTGQTNSGISVNSAEEATINNSGGITSNYAGISASVVKNSTIFNRGEITINDVNGLAAIYANNTGATNITNVGMLVTSNTNAKGIYASGLNTTNIINNGEISSGNTAIDIVAAQDINSTLHATNNGEITSDIDSVISIANSTSNSSAIFDNNGEITGYVNLDSLANNTTASTMNNEGTWTVRDVTNSNGIVNNNFGNGTLNGMLNNTGTITMDSSVTEANFNNVDITNSGSFAIASNYANYQPININFNGNYIGNGGSLYVRTDVQNLTTDQYNILGDASGSSKLYVKLINAANPKAIGTEGLEVVIVGGTNNLNLTLGRPVTAGMYEYLLFKNSNDNWALGTHTDLINPAVGAYLANQTAATSMFNHTLYDREGQATFTGGKSTAEARNFWIRTNMQHGSYDSVGGKLSNRSHTYKIEFGSDLAVWRLLDGNFHLGVMGGYGDNETKSRSRATGSKIKGKVQGYNAGVYGTWFQNDDGALGLYVDTWTQFGWYRNRVEGDSMSSTKRYNSNVWTSSMEIGYGISLGKDAAYEYLLTPQAQLTYKQYDADNQHDANDLYVTSNNASGLDTRLGARISARGIDKPRVEPYLELNWLNTNAKNSLKFNGTKLHDGIPDSRLEAKIGLQGHITDRLSMGAQVSGNWGDNSYKEYQGTLNMSYKF